eukprot:CAMPEP_0172446014 /NCGR_PEP_ID=MMETSP1065-20121228/5721_1 /TAXON_ID=265537 /ORGANISM="Amphiprora paludosa, Strain CCMP125" /LENGTH=669 /DNA_ID=CAMNT_0013197031 /DNA_START=295 /DNA_END=2304 /DNA_ORIENTATION=+
MLSIDAISLAYQFQPQGTTPGGGNLNLFHKERTAPWCSSRLGMATISDEAADGQQTSEELESEEENNNTDFQFSKSKWKKKRFLMMKDVNAAVHKRQAKAAIKAEEMVRRMWTLYEKTGEADFRPDLQVYNLWIHAVAKSNPSRHRASKDDLATGRRAEQILEEMRERGVAPNVVSYTSVMDAYANQGRLGDRQAPAEAERVLFDLLERSEYSSNLQVTAVTSDTVLNAWAQQGTWESAERAELILQRLEAMTDPTTNSGPVAKLVRPTAHSYATVIHAWAKSGGGADAARRAQAILDRLLTETKQPGDEDAVRPDNVIFNAVIDAWASSGDPQCGSKAVELLRQMKDLDEGLYCDNCAPDVVTYNSVLSAWSRSGHINSAVQAERILKEMILARKEDPERNPAPNVISYNTVLHAWSKSSLDGAAERAETLLKFMARSDQGDIVPDVYSYSSVLDAIAKSKTPGKALRAKSLLEHMLESPAIKPDKLTPVPFNAVINAAAFSAVGTCDEERREALQVAVKIFPLMRSLGVEKDTISYGTMLKAIANLVPAGDKRYTMSLQLFADCCDKGLVEDLVWNEVQRCVPDRMMSDHVGMGPVKSLRLRDLPRQWRRNQRSNRSRRRRTKGAPEYSKQNSGSKNNNSNNEDSQPQPFRRNVVISEASWQSGRDM